MVISRDRRALTGAGKIISPIAALLRPNYRKTLFPAGSDIGERYGKERGSRSYHGLDDNAALADEEFTCRCGLRCW